MHSLVHVQSPIEAVHATGCEGSSPKRVIAAFWSGENHCQLFPRNCQFLLFCLYIRGLYMSIYQGSVYVHIPGMRFWTKPSCARKGLGPGAKMQLPSRAHSSSVALGHGGPWCSRASHDIFPGCASRGQHACNLVPISAVAVGLSTKQGHLWRDPQEGFSA